MAKPRMPKALREKNARRIELIHKEFGEGLTLPETDEMKKLSLEVENWVNDNFPLPFDQLEKARKAFGLSEAPVVKGD